MSHPFDAPAFHRGLDAYHERRFYDAHEHWEELWVDEEDDTIRRFLQALIQIATTLHKITAGVAPRGCIPLVEKVTRHLDALPDDVRGFAVPPLRAAVARLTPAITRLVESGGRDLDPALIPEIPPPR